jgi:PPE-repeat protein
MPSAWGLPPEVNNMMLRSGAGAAAHAPQVAAYTAAAANYATQASTQTMTAMATAPDFVGLGGAAMMSQALPMASWHAAAAVHAESAAVTLSTGISAYETTVMSMIPAERCVANRIETTALHASNILGQNTPAIIEHEVEYAEYWAQNASARTGLAATLAGLSGELSVPLPPYPGMANPAAGAAIAGEGIGQAGFGVGASMLGAGTSSAAGAISTVLGTGLSTGLGTPLSTGLGAPLPTDGLPFTPSPTPTPAAATAPGMPAAGMPAAVSPPSIAAPLSGPQTAPPLKPPVAPPDAKGGLTGSSPDAMSAVMGQAAQLPSAAMSPLQSITQTIGAPLTMLTAGLSALTSGMSGNPAFSKGSNGGQASSSARSPLTGMSDVNGGYAAGGSPVSASIGDAAHDRLAPDWATAGQTANPDVADAASGVHDPAGNPGVGVIPPPMTGARQDERSAPVFEPSYKTVVAPRLEGAVVN